jgi:hypothetical protein
MSLLEIRLPLSKIKGMLFGIMRSLRMTRLLPTHLRPHLLPLERDIAANEQEDTCSH